MQLARTLAFDQSGALLRVVWNAHDRVAGTFDGATERALDAFQALLHLDHMRCHLELRPGEAVLVDNCVRGFYEVATQGRAPAPQVDRSIAFSRTRRVVKSVGRQPFHAP